MISDDRMDLLRALLRRQPSVQVWGEILNLFAGWPEGSEKEIAIGEAMVGLQGWDEKYLQISSQWMPLFSSNRLSSIGRLARQITFHRREEGTGDLICIAESTNSGGIRHLSFDRCDIYEQGIVALAASQHLKSLAHLSFKDTYLGPKETFALLQGLGLPNLSSIELISCFIQDDALDALQNSPFTERLISLNLSRNRLTDKTARLFASLSNLVRLTTLILEDTDITATGRSMLELAPHLQKTRLVF